ncbi:MAG: hypothetical protein KTU85_06570 [Acidimicrobiia bacterium]|nr:hypothetical protein [Acidimicrobiia bacterium]MCY4456575.1 hypothetical protein [Acidimicrobiaceae bacterium]
MTNGQTKDRVFRSYEELERELMPNRAKERRANRMGEDLDDLWLEIMRKTINRDRRGAATSNPI